MSPPPTRYARQGRACLKGKPSTYPATEVSTERRTARNTLHSVTTMPLSAGRNLMQRGLPQAQAWRSGCNQSGPWQEAQARHRLRDTSTSPNGAVCPDQPRVADYFRQSAISAAPWSSVKSVGSALAKLPLRRAAASWRAASARSLPISFATASLLRATPSPRP